MYKLKEVTKKFINKNNEIIALKEISYEFPDKGLIFILGKSGCGKSTLLNILGGLDTPTNGSITFGDYKLNSDDFRRHVVSYVFQDFNLINDFSVIDNISLVGGVKDEIYNTVLPLLDLKNKANVKIKYLSGGEKQRVAIGRSIAKNSSVILLDEPTGNLDKKNSEIVFSTLKELSKTKLVIVVSHDDESAYKYADTVIKMIDGTFYNIEDLKQETKYILKPNEYSDVFKLYEQLSSDNSVMILENNENIERIMVNKKTFFDIMKKIIDDLDEKKEICVFLEKNKETTNYNLKINNDKKAFNLSFQLKYMLNLIISNKVKFIFSLLLISLTLVISIVGTTILSYDLEKTIYEGVKSSSNYSFKIKQDIYNDPTEEKFSHYKGKKLYNLLNNQKQDISSCFLIENITTLNSNYLFNSALLNVVDEKYVENNFHCSLTDSEIIVSDVFLKYYHPNLMVGDEISLSVNSFARTNFKIKKIIETNYNTENLLSKMLDEEYVYNKVEELLQYYFSVFTTEKVYYSCMNDSSITLESANFLYYDNDYSSYTNEYNSLVYTSINNIDSELLIEGRIPNEKNEILISDTFFQDKFKGNIDDVLNIKFKYKNLEDSINYNKYLSTFNMHDIIGEVYIVGIIDTKEDVVVSNLLFDEIIKESIYYSIDYFSILNPTYNFIKDMSDSELIFDSYYLAPAYSTDNLLKSSFNVIIILLITIFIVISALIIYYFSNTSIKQKIREVSIIKSLGVKTSIILKVFIYYNTCITFISTILSIIGGTSLIYFINKTLMKEDVFNIQYSIFTISFIVFLLLILFSLIINLIGTIIPFIKIKKLNIADNLKNNQ